VATIAGGVIGRNYWTFQVTHGEDNIAYYTGETRGDPNSTRASQPDAIAESHPYRSAGFRNANIELRLPRYLIAADKLQASITFQAAVLVVLIASLLNPRGTQKIPGIEVSLDPKLVTIIASAVLCYNAMHFLNNFRDAINSRNALFDLLSVEYAPLADSPCHPDLKGHILSQRPILSDNGIIDAWFVAFRPDRHDFFESMISKSNGLLQQHAIVVWAIFWGAVCGCTLAAFRELSSTALTATGRLSFVAAEQLVLIALLSANFAFAFAANNKNWAQLVSGAAAVSCYLFMTRLAARNR
jgi:hypothetical protein